MELADRQSLAPISILEEHCAKRNKHDNVYFLNNGLDDDAMRPAITFISGPELPPTLRDTMMREAEAQTRRYPPRIVSSGQLGKRRYCETVVKVNFCADP